MSNKKSNAPPWERADFPEQLQKKRAALRKKAEETKEQRQTKRTTCIEKIETMLNNDELPSYFAEMVSNQYVQEYLKQNNLSINIGQLKLYLENARTGLYYLKNHYSEGAIPSLLTFYTGLANIRGERTPDFIFYSPTDDKIGVSYLHIARDCSHYDDGSMSLIQRASKRYVVKTKWFTVLQFIEEGYHRYQILKKGMKTYDVTKKVDHLETEQIEIEIADVFDRAINYLRIPLEKVKP